MERIFPPAESKRKGKERKGKERKGKERKGKKERRIKLKRTEGKDEGKGEQGNRGTERKEKGKREKGKGKREKEKGKEKERRKGGKEERRKRKRRKEESKPLPTDGCHSCFKIQEGGKERKAKESDCGNDIFPSDPQAISMPPSISDE